MKTKSFFIFLAVLVLASLACGIETPAEKSIPTRAAVIQTAAANQTTEESWAGVPISCSSSLSQLSAVNDKGEKLAASGTLISTQVGQNSNGEFGYLYTFISANHFNEDTQLKMSSQVEVTVNKTGELAQSVMFSVTNQKHLVDDNGIKVDIVLISVFGPNPAQSVNGSGPLPITADNIISGMNILPDPNKFYHILGYPEATNVASFTIVKVTTDNSSYHGYKTLITETFSDEFGTVTRGNSGGQLCNNDGKVAGVVTHITENYKEAVVIPLPDSIQGQINSFLNESSEALKMIGFSSSP